LFDIRDIDRGFVNLAILQSSEVGRYHAWTHVSHMH